MHDWDVIIVGGGGAGLAAAVAAARSGARTLLLEKGARLGGTTRLAVGSISAPNTRLQRRNRVADDSQAFAEDSREFTGALAARDDMATRQLMASEAAETVRFLEELGIAFVGPFPEPGHRVPRMLNVVPGSRAYIAALAHETRVRGATIRTGVRVEALRIDDGAVVGVTATAGHRTESLHAARGVILAAGDYSASPELRATHIREEARHVGAVNPLSTGDGHVLGAQAGGQLVNMDITDGPQLRFPPPAAATILDRLPASRVLSNTLAGIGNRLPSFILRRFARQLLTAWMAPSPEFMSSGPVLVNINGYGIDATDDGLAYAVSRQPEQTSYLILSKSMATTAEAARTYISTAPGIAYAYWRDYRRGRRDLITAGATIASLAQRLGMDPDALHKSVRTSPSSSHFVTGPYYAIGPLRSLFTTTEGGLRVDHECRVVRSDGQPVAGLWAAGSNGQSGMVLSGHGVHILWAITSGRLAGASAARTSGIRTGGRTS